MLTLRGLLHTCILYIYKCVPCFACVCFFGIYYFFTFYTEKRSNHVDNMYAVKSWSLPWLSRSLGPNFILYYFRFLFFFFVALFICTFGACVSLLCFYAHRIWPFVLLMLSHISVCIISFMWVYWPLASPYHRSLSPCLFAFSLNIYVYCHRMNSRHTHTHTTPHCTQMWNCKRTQQAPNIGWFRCIKSIIVFLARSHQVKVK